MLKIILADSQAIFRAGAAKVLAVEDDFRIVAQCENTERMLAAVESFRANVLIFSTAMHVDIRQLVELSKGTKTRLIIVIESADNSAQYLQLGISGVVFRNVSGTALVECVRKVSAARLGCRTQERQPKRRRMTSSVPASATVSRRKSYASSLSSCRASRIKKLPPSLEPPSRSSRIICATSMTRLACQTGSSWHYSPSTIAF